MEVLVFILLLIVGVFSSIGLLIWLWGTDLGRFLGFYFSVITAIFLVWYSAYTYAFGG